MNTKYIYQSRTKRSHSYKAYRYHWINGEELLSDLSIAIVIREKKGRWIATLSNTGAEVVTGHGKTRDAAVDDALSAIGE